MSFAELFKKTFGTDPTPEQIAEAEASASAGVRAAVEANGPVAPATPVIAADPAQTGAVSQADGVALDEDGFAIETSAVEDGKANTETPAEIANDDYQGIGGANGVIPGESRSRLN